MFARKFVATAAIAAITLIARDALAQNRPAAPAAPAPPPMTSSPLPDGRVTYRTLPEVNNELERIAKANPNRIWRSPKAF